MNYTHCQKYASQIIQSFKFKIAFLFFVGAGLKGCVVFLKTKKEYWKKEKKQKRELTLASFKLLTQQKNFGCQVIPQ